MNSTPGNTVDAALQAKKEAKNVLQESLGLNVDPRMPILCIPTGVSEATGGKLLAEILPGLLSLHMQILVLGKGSAEYGQLMLDTAKKYPLTMAIVENTPDSLKGMILGSDMALFTANAGAKEELQTALNAGTVPVCPPAAMLQNYDQNREIGNAFIFDDLTMWHAFAALVRAMETYRFPYDWKTIQKHCLAS